MMRRPLFRSTVLAFLIAAAIWTKLGAADVVRMQYTEGVFHAFLAVRTNGDETLATGDLRQDPKGGNIESHLSFRFKDGSAWDEIVSFTQQRVLSLNNYHYTQRGPSFPQDLDATLERPSGKYRVKTKSQKDAEEKVLEGTIELPDDLYNGLIFTALKNMKPGTEETVHYVVFLPKPELIQLQLVPLGDEKLRVGTIEKTARHYVLKPQLGTLRKLFAKLTGRMPPDNQAWILADEVPTFLKFEGPLYEGGPTWHVQLTSPTLPN
jgi:hypothetical protein